ncbi:MAG: replication factor C large subunit [Candidatus Woesearchaeota archaeon]
MELLWTKKYQPKKISEVVGQQEAVFKIKDFVLNFNKQKKRALFIYGPVGCGKTSAVQAVANELNYELLEINASDTRNSETIEMLVGNAIRQKSFFYKGKIILVDEVDGISGVEDRGGIATLSKLVKETNFPIIIIGGDAYDQKFSELRKNTLLLEFKKLETKDILLILKNIAENEKIVTKEEYLRIIARRVDGDARAAITDLQTIAYDRKITEEEINALSYREKEESMQNALIKIFKNSDLKIALSAFERVGESQDKLIYWVDENLPYEYKNIKDLSSAYYYLSKADIFQSRILKRQDWRFLVYINALITGGVVVSKTQKNKEIMDYKQTTRFLKMWLANQKYSKRKAIASKIAEKTHTSTSETIKNFWYFQIIFQKNKKMANAIAEEIGLDKEEVEWLCSRY